jgi:hypothetical protein
LLRFVHKTLKNRLQGDFLPCKLRRTEGSQAGRIIGIFCGIKRKKSTSATGCQAHLSSRISTDSIWFFPVRLRTAFKLLKNAFSQPKG